MPLPEVIRKSYINKLNELASDIGTIKVISGIRYSGKSVLLRQFRDSLMQKGTPEGRVVYINMHDHLDELDDSYKFTSLVTANVLSEDSYLLVDDISLVAGWADAVSDIRSRFPTLNIYIVIPFARSEYYGNLLEKIGNYKVLILNLFSFKEFLEAYPVTDEHGYGERFDHYLTVGA